jgi:hypothetical protein
VTSPAYPRYPDLIGKAGILAGSGTSLVDLAHAFATNNVLLAIVSTNRGTVEDAVRAAESRDVAVMGMTTDPGSPQVWERITQHIEQRLGPIDIVVAVGTSEVRDTIRTALVPDMTARGRGVLIEIGSSEDSTTSAGGVRRVRLQAVGLQAEDLVATVLCAASDTARPQVTG